MWITLGLKWDYVGTILNEFCSNIYSSTLADKGVNMSPALVLITIKLVESGMSPQDANDLIIRFIEEEKELIENYKAQ